MVERLEAAAETGAEYYMVTVSESVTFSYPALATDAEAAREKVAALIEAGRVRAPLDRIHQLVGAPCRREGIEVVDAVESEDLSCRQVCAQTLTPGEAERLVDDVEAGKLYEKTPPQMAHAAKSILKKTGSGKLTPTKRQRK